MNFKTFLALLDNAEFLLILNVIYEFSNIFLRRFKHIHWLIRGILIGFIGIIIMSVPYEFSNGIEFDTRSILLSATALGIQLALEEIKKNSGILYNSEIVRTCVELFEKDNYELDDKQYPIRLPI